MRENEESTNNGNSKPIALILGGKRGLLGQALDYCFSSRGWSTHAQGGGDVDIFDQQALAWLIDRVEPDVVFNTIAYTAVDQAEEHAEEADRLNRRFPFMLARILKTRSIPLVTYSTDFVFDGRKQKPYQVTDEPNPICVYGKSKLAGERALQDSGLDKLLIIRTSWLFGPWKNNFVHTMVELAKTRKSLSVVHDQVGSPTYTLDLARYTGKLFTEGATGVFHLCNSGQASWCELASETLATTGSNCKIQAIDSSQYPQKAKRPPFSVLDTSSFSSFCHEKPRPWPLALRDYMFGFEADEVECD